MTYQVENNICIMLHNDSCEPEGRYHHFIHNVPLRTRKSLSPYSLYSGNALLVLNGTSLKNGNALLAFK